MDEEEFHTSVLKVKSKETEHPDPRILENIAVNMSAQKVTLTEVKKLV